ncbi:unnamed protein product [Spirodela intermedia]|uniref:Uncharacterized protein n=1 Tax=Spirodela intermedia TaxID=51605 RepID=A0A7I8JNM6_SPIIN|nr:unnamed protein product [Spirodela intermedia]CAA6671183.1 unnamed protein product [Spirodela intermedia]
MALALGKTVFSGILLAVFILSVTKYLLLPLVSPSSSPTPAWLSLPALLALIVPSVVSGSRRLRNLPPGPLSLPVFGNWLQVGNDLNHRLLASLAGKYGLATEVLHTQGVEFGSRPRNMVFDIFTGGGQDMVFTVYGDHWRKMRRVMTLPFFTNKVVQQYRGMWEEEMDLAVADLGGAGGGEWARPEGVVVRRRLQLMLYNVMYRMMFDTKFESVRDPLFLQATQFNSERSRLAQSFEYNYGDFIPVLRPLLRGYLRRCRDLQTRRLAFFNAHYIQKRREVLAVGEKNRQKKLSCAMDHILEAEMNGEISPENVLYIVENINVAAIETTLWSMEWAIAELVNHPEVQSKLRRELEGVLRGAALTEAELPRLPYLQAVVRETLRLHTPIPLLVPHMNLEEAKLGGYDIPKESKVVVNAWWLANNPAWWKDPSEFRPERFLEEERETEAAVAGGSCPGIILALPLLALVVGKLGKVDVTEKGGQFSLHLAKHSVVVFQPVNPPKLSSS